MVEYKKICKGCNLNLSFTQFNKHSTTKDGLRSKCINCRRIEHITYRQNNPEKMKDYDKRKLKRPISREKRRVRDRKYREKHREYLNSYFSMRRGMERQATPLWLNKEEILEISELFIICKMFKIYTGEEYHVDHIVPINNKKVCGLHVPWNLTVISEKENKSKSNKFYEHSAIDHSASAYSKVYATT